jgi:hypothetical protein
MGFEEDYAGVLQNLESAIVSVYREDADLLDYDVSDALEILIRYYRSIAGGLEPRAVTLDGRPQAVFDAVQQVCEYRLGRGELGGLPAVGEAGVMAVSADELVQCLKRILKSVQRWHKQGGRRGYLDFITDYV